MPQVSFAGDIKPLFRAIDISHMKSAGVKLNDYTYMSDPNNANKVHSGETIRLVFLKGAQGNDVSVDLT